MTPPKIEPSGRDPYLDQRAGRRRNGAVDRWDVHLDVLRERRVGSLRARSAGGHDCRITARVSARVVEVGRACDVAGARERGGVRDVLLGRGARAASSPRRRLGRQRGTGRSGRPQTGRGSVRAHRSDQLLMTRVDSAETVIAGRGRDERAIGVARLDVAPASRDRCRHRATSPPPARAEGPSVRETADAQRARTRCPALA